MNLLHWKKIPIKPIKYNQKQLEPLTEKYIARTLQKMLVNKALQKAVLKYKMPTEPSNSEDADEMEVEKTEDRNEEENKEIEDETAELQKVDGGIEDSDVDSKDNSVANMSTTSADISMEVPAIAPDF